MNEVATGGFMALAPGEGQAVWFLDTLMTVKADAARTAGSYMVVECLLPPGFGPPPHVHHEDDEAFYVLDGELSGFCGEWSWRGAPGSFILLPRGLPHGFRVEGDTPARVLQLGNGSGFERFITEAGEPARAATLPPPPGPDAIARMQAAAPKYGIEIFAPPAV